MNAIVEDDRPVSSSAVANPFGRAVAPSAQLNAVGAAMEQRAIAEVQASYIMAEKFPRDERAAADRILTAFGRQKLAESATYEYSRGGSAITGPSIRAAEAIAQQWGNLDVGFSEVARFRDDRGVGVSIVRAQCIDLQSRTRKYIDFQCRHWRDTKSGGYPLNDERDIYELVANQAQRRVRACILAQIPSDVVEAAVDQAEQTVASKIQINDETIKALIDAFETFGVTKDHIEARIQRRIESITKGNMLQMRRIFASLRDSMSKPSDWFEMGEPSPDAPPAANALNAKLAERKAAAAAATPATPVALMAAEKSAGAAEPPTFAQVADAIAKLDTAAGATGVKALIAQVASEQHQIELSDLLAERLDALRPVN